jgi:hypothetical protein
MMDTTKVEGIANEFDVNDVVPHDKPLELTRYLGYSAPDEADTIAMKIDAVGDAAAAVAAMYGGNNPVASSEHALPIVYQSFLGHTFFGALHWSFATHYPLSLSPDAIWLILVQGLTVAIENEDALTRQVVPGLPKEAEEIFVGRHGEPDWERFVTEAADEICRRSPAATNLLCDFSTSGATERIASCAIMMKALEHHYTPRYGLMCGIPRIRMEGTPGDWSRLVDKFDSLTAHVDDPKLSAWRTAAIDVLERMAESADGRVDRELWENFYKDFGFYGSHFFNGHCKHLTPFTSPAYNGRLAESGAVTKGSNDILGPGMSAAPFSFEESHGSWKEMQLLGGFVGMTQDPDDLFVRPEIGWAMRQA